MSRESKSHKVEENKEILEVVLWPYNGILNDKEKRDSKDLGRSMIHLLDFVKQQF